MLNRETMASMLIQGVGLNVSGMILLIGVSSLFGPLGWTGLGAALIVKLIGDGQLLRAYWLWQTRHQADS